MRARDLTGMVFGKLTAISPAGASPRGRLWLCRCSCGTEKVVGAADLTTSNTRSCGKEACRGRLIDLTGHRYGKLTVMRFLYFGKDSTGAVWECRCTCGTLLPRTAHNLRQAHVKTCGGKLCKVANARESMLKPDGHAIKWNAYSSHIRGAVVRKIASTLTFEEYLAIASKPCVYCGQMSIRKETRRKIITIKLNSVDRKDNELFYALHNSQSTCFVCQYMKGEMTDAEFRSHNAKVRAHLTGE